MHMKEENKKALIVAYYLSKYGDAAYSNLKFKTQREAHANIGQTLNVKPSSVKNMRDEFDPLHDNSRVGWYQRPLRPSRADVVNRYKNVSESELFKTVQEILRQKNVKIGWLSNTVATSPCAQVTYDSHIYPTSRKNSQNPCWPRLITPKLPLFSRLT